MGRIDNKFAGLEPLPLGRLFGSHSLVNSLTRRPVTTGGLSHGSSTAACAPGSLRCPTTAIRRGLGGLFRLGPMTRLACHCRLRGSHAPVLTVPQEKLRKNYAPEGSVEAMFFLLVQYISHYPQKSKP